jgi:oxidase EvaA
VIDPGAARAFLASAVRPADAGPTPDPEAILAERTRANRYEVRPVALGDLPRWRLGDDLAHDTRRFFTIEGLAIATNFGATPRWSQPIIMQPEIGILGFLVKRIDGAMHILAQAKMEPGNKVMVQFSPTVQATPSNYMRVHGGRAQPHIEHFLGPTRGRVLVDQLQSEQGTRYYRKRNRNMIVELPEDEDFPITSDFAWLSLSQIRGLCAAGGRINMNARTVLACIGYAGAAPAVADPFRQAVLESHLAPVGDDDLLGALGWLADLKTAFHLDTRRVRLGDLEHWICDGESIRHESGRFFRVIGVEVAAENREIGAWMQPMFAPTRAGSIAFLCQRRDGLLQFLVQARVEPGFIDGMELGATLQFSPPNYLRPADLPPFAAYLDCPPSWVRLRAPQSEDGGRFYHDDTTNVVIELPEDERIDLPRNFRWMPLALLKRLMRRGFVVDVEARSLMACLL